LVFMPITSLYALLAHLKIKTFRFAQFIERAANLTDTHYLARFLRSREKFTAASYY